MTFYNSQNTVNNSGPYYCTLFCQSFIQIAEIMKNKIKWIKQNRYALAGTVYMTDWQQQVERVSVL
jgi:hypothetical protein